MPPRKKVEASSAVKADRKPLKKLTTLSFGPSPLSPRSRTGQSSTASSSKATGKRKVDVIELNSDVEEILDSSDDIGSRSAHKPRVPLQPAARSNDKGKGKAEEAPAKGKGRTADAQADAQLWTDLYAPRTLDDLAVNKKKVAEVRDWLLEALPPASASSANSQAAKISRYRRIIALTGPAGVGKTACIKAVVDSICSDLVEWSEGFEEWGMNSGDIERETVISRLEGFMMRSSLPSLDMPGPSSAAPSSTHPPGSRRKILLLDALPNLGHRETRVAFQTLLQQFAQSEGGAPLVLIVSDPGETGRAGEGWGQRGQDGGWGWRDILGKDVLALAGVRTVGFNAVPPTSLAKALNRILPLAVPTASQRPPKDAVQLIVHSSQGDVRAAVNALQFLCRAQVKQGRAALAKKATGAGSRGGKPPRGTDKALKSLLDAVTRREQSLVLFHALGKVLWNKRLGDPKEDAGEEEDYPPLPPEQIPLPDHLVALERRRSKVDVETLFKEAPVDTGLFNLYLHQNYPVFCSDIDECAESIEVLSQSDALKTDEDLWQSSPVAIAYAFNTTVRGLLNSLPSPMPHRGQKVYKPDWFAAHREQRTNEEAVDDIGRWIAGVGLCLGGGGQISRRALTTQIIPELRRLEIPPTYPASLPDLAYLDYATETASRSSINMQSILLGADDAAEDSADELDSKAAVERDPAAVGGGSLESIEASIGRPQSIQAVMFTAREEDDGLDTGGGGSDGDLGSGDEIEGDEIGDFSD